MNTGCQIFSGIDLNALQTEIMDFCDDKKEELASFQVIAVSQSQSVGGQNNTKPTVVITLMYQY